MDDFAASFDRFDHLLAFSFVELLDWIVRGNDKVSVQKRDGSSFGLSVNSVMVHPKLEQVPKARIVVIL